MSKKQVKAMAKELANNKKEAKEFAKLIKELYNEERKGLL